MNGRQVPIDEAFAAHPLETYITTMAEIFLTDMEYAVFMLALPRTAYLMEQKNPLPDKEALHTNIILSETFGDESKADIGSTEGTFDTSRLLGCFPKLINKGFLARYAAQDKETDTKAQNYSCNTRFYFDVADFLYITTAKLLYLCESIEADRKKIGKVTNVEFECTRCKEAFDKAQSAMIYKTGAHLTHTCPNCLFPGLRRVTSKSSDRTAREAQLLEYQAKVIEELTQMGLHLCKIFNQHKESLRLQLKGIQDRYNDKRESERAWAEKRRSRLYPGQEDSESEEEGGSESRPGQEAASLAELIPKNMMGAGMAIASGNAAGLSLARALASREFTLGGAASKLGAASVQMSRRRLRLEHEGVDPASLFRRRRGAFWRSCKVAANTLDGNWVNRALPWFKKLHFKVHDLLKR